MNRTKGRTATTAIAATKSGAIDLTKEFFTLREAAAIIGVTYHTIQCGTGWRELISAQKVYHGKPILVSRRRLRALGYL